MPIAGHDHERPRRDWTLRLFLAYGVAGAAILGWQTVARWDETAATLARLDDAPLVIAIFVAVSLASAFLKFQLTDKFFVAFIVVDCAAMIPLLGGVVTAWIAVGASVFARLLGLRGIGPIRYDDPPLERTRMFGQLMVYGVPALLAAAVYERMGGLVPVASATLADALRIALTGAFLSLANGAAMSLALRTYGYAYRKIVTMLAIDTLFVMAGLPYAIASPSRR